MTLLMSSLYFIVFVVTSSSEDFEPIFYSGKWEIVFPLSDLIYFISVMENC